MYLTSPAQIAGFNANGKSFGRASFLYNTGMIGDQSEEEEDLEREDSPHQQCVPSGSGSSSASATPSMGSSTVSSQQSAPSGSVMSLTPTSHPIHPRMHHPDDVRPPVVPGRIRPTFNLRVANERKRSGMGIYPFPIMSLTLRFQTPI